MGLGTILGGTLQGLGAGMAAQFKMKDEERREQALAALKASAMEKEYELRGKNEISVKTLENAGATIRQDDQQAFVAEQGRAAATAAQAALVTKTQAEKDAEEAKFRRDQVLKKLESDLKIRESAASSRLAAQIRAGEVKDIRSSEDGTTYVIYNNGKFEKAEGVAIKPQPRASTAGDSLFGATPPASKSAAPVKVTSIQQAMELKPGTRYITPDGREMVR